MLDHPLTVYRTENNLSMEDLAKLAGTTRQSVFRIEAGKQSPLIGLSVLFERATSGAVTVGDLAQASARTRESETA